MPVHGPHDCQGSNLFGERAVSVTASVAGPSRVLVRDGAAASCTRRSHNAQVRMNENCSCDKFNWYRVPRPIHPDWYRNPSGIGRSGAMSKPPTYFEMSEAREVMRL